MVVSEGAAPDAAAEKRPPLCVDLDGSLLVVDSLHETFLAALARDPWSAITAMASLRRGKAVLKRRLAEVAPLEPGLLPYNEVLLSYLREEKARGRELALVSAADQSIVTAVADHLGLFDHALGSDGTTNLSGVRKLEAIRKRYGAGFAYVGNAEVDLAIWREATAALMVGHQRKLMSKVELSTPVELCFPLPDGGVSAWLHELRLHQWAKNGLIFVPILLAGPVATPADLLAATLGFLVFGLLASAGYIINDLLDLAADRRHPHKRTRPLAAGTLVAKSAVLGALAMLTTAALGAFALGWSFLFTAVAYFGGTVAYSLALKRIPMLDVIILAGLFTIRVIAGTTLIETPFSYWLITFSLFLFLSLALVKRHAELSSQSPGDESMFASRRYSAADLHLIVPFGTSCAVAATLVFVIYLVEERFPTERYAQPAWLWLIVPVLMFWLMRIWRLAAHGRMSQDPVLFSIKDRVSLTLGGVVLLLVVLAW